MAYAEQDYVDGWVTYSRWIDNLRNSSEIIRDYDANSTFRNDLLACKSNLDRFQLIWNTDQLRREIERIYEDDNLKLKLRLNLRQKKSIDQSKRLRELGNKSFKEKNFIEALKHYTRAIIVAPYPSEANNNDDSLAVAFANRSAALYSLSRYRICLADIELAVKYGYPRVNMFKLMIRKVKCLHVLSIWANDIEQIKENLKAMSQGAQTKEAIKIEINNMFEFIEQTHPEEVEKDELDMVDETALKLSNASKTVSQAADCVEMSYEQDKGRYLLTNKDVSFGRLLLAEEPFVCNLAPSKFDQYCYRCLGRLNLCGVSCKTCTLILYCSLECLEAHSEVHEYECNNLIEFHRQIGVAYLVAQILFKIKFNFTSIPVHTKKTVDYKNLDQVLSIPTSDWPDLVYKNNYASVLSLLDHAEDYSFDEMMGYALTAVYLNVAFMKQLSSCIKVIPGKSLEQTQLVIGSVILRHLLQLQTNLISILDQSLQDVVAVGHTISEMKEHPIGVGLYPTVSLLNHSCRPNIFSIFHRNKFVARAASGLECGTKINYCYGPSFNRMTKKDRQSRLKEQYFFTCQCDCCSNNKENEGRALVCDECQGPVIYNQDLTNECLGCHRTEVANIGDRLKQVEEIRSSLGELQLSDENTTEKLNKLRQFEVQLGKLVFWRNPLFVQIKSQLIDCAENQDDLVAALKYCDEELALSDKTYGKDSFESIMTKLKWINLRWQYLYNQIEESENEESKSLSIAELRALIPIVGATRGKLRELLNSTSILGAESSFDKELKYLAQINSNINKYLASLDAPQPSTS